MKKYSVTNPEELRSLCIRNKWFTCGSNRQYEKLFYANEGGALISEIATIIWLCSDDDCRRSDILDILVDTHRKYILNLIRTNEGEEEKLYYTVKEFYNNY